MYEYRMNEICPVKKQIVSSSIRSALIFFGALKADEIKSNVNYKTGKSLNEETGDLKEIKE